MTKAHGGGGRDGGEARVSVTLGAARVSMSVRVGGSRVRVGHVINGNAVRHTKRVSVTRFVSRHQRQRSQAHEASDGREATAQHLLALPSIYLLT